MPSIPKWGRTQECCWIWVLNLIISGIPSIHPVEWGDGTSQNVLNLIITGLPSIRKNLQRCHRVGRRVLNLILLEF